MQPFLVLIMQLHRPARELCKFQYVYMHHLKQSLTYSDRAPTSILGSL